jgi:murein L,D-transpeptidase YcbB/YkuD
MSHSGRVRFNFPNQFLVYQHDSPDKYMSSKPVRAYSHGCMRVEHPDQYAETLLSISQPQEGYTAFVRFTAGVSRMSI